MRKLLITLLLGTLLLAGCMSSITKSTRTELEGNIYVTPVDYTTTEKSSVGFSPGKYTVGNFAPGKQADLPIVLHNGSDETLTVAIMYRIPDYVEEGYTVAPKEVEGWLTIPEPLLELRPREKREVILTLNMPKDADVVGKWEFWVSIKDASQIGMVQTEGCVRIFVNMR